MPNQTLKAPFPWFGGKSRVADKVWPRFGDCENYIEPFAGSLAVLLARPHQPKLETVNDKDCYLANFWRALKLDPAGVAEHADWPVNETDLHARHLWLVAQEHFRNRMNLDPEYFDSKIAGWWVWGVSQWIGSHWCSKPTWKRSHAGAKPRGLQCWKKRPNIGHTSMSGVHRNLNPTDGREGRTAALRDYIQLLADRLNRVRVCCGDWKRVLSPNVTYKIGQGVVTAIFLDPPYSLKANRQKHLYIEDSLILAEEVREWAIENGSNPKLRIALCGYEGEHRMPDNWFMLEWKANGGYSNRTLGGNGNAALERIWFSPACILDKGNFNAR